MKIQQMIFLENRISINAEQMRELHTLLEGYCSSIRYNASSKDDSRIDYDDIDELLSQKNFGARKIKKLEIRGSDSNTLTDIRIELDNPISGRNIVISYVFHEKDSETLFITAIKSFFEARKDGDRAYRASRWLSLFCVGGLAFLALCLYVKHISTDLNAFMPWLFIGMLVIAATLLVGVCNKLFPAVSFVWGEEIKHYENLVKYRNNIFWCGIVTTVISVVVALVL